MFFFVLFCFVFVFVFLFLFPEDPGDDLDESGKNKIVFYLIIRARFRKFGMLSCPSRSLFHQEKDARFVCIFKGGLCH